MWKRWVGLAFARRGLDGFVREIPRGRSERVDARGGFVRGDAGLQRLGARVGERPAGIQNFELAQAPRLVSRARGFDGAVGRWQQFAFEDFDLLERLGERLPCFAELRGERRLRRAFLRFGLFRERLRLGDVPLIAIGEWQRN